jgi:Mg2+ and Co2+ transporter CorA
LQNVLSDATHGHIAGIIDFAGLHNVSKHITHLREGSDAALLTLQRLIQYLERSSNKSTPATASEQTHDSLEHSQTLFNSTKLRLLSLESRMANVINLSFYLVTQQDSKSMKTIAFLTLIFLPASTVASIFGSQFFNLSVDQDGVSHFIFSHWFWIMWVIILPVTAILVAVWWWPEAMASDLKEERQWSCKSLLRLGRVGEVEARIPSKLEMEIR